ncbi:MAG: hypothetical protein L0J79_06320, partial [Propionibacterium sp.]|nr:hypothetical protein [Propionibacterium sp.]
MPETDEHARSHLSGPPGGAGVDPDSASGQLRDVALAFLARYQGTAQARGEMRQRVGSPGG